MQQEAYLSRLSIIELDEKIWVSGNLIRGSRIPQNGKGRLSHFLFVVRSYFRKPIKRATVKGKLGKVDLEFTTDSKGHFSKVIDSPLPVDFEFFYKNQSLRITEDYPVLFPKPISEYEVISDLDDTVLLSHTASALKRVRNILFLAPRKKKTILFTFQLMQCFKDLRFRVHYLSKSESNLYQVIADFIDYHKLPKGALLLSPHLKWNQLLKPNKGKDYKLKHLKELLQNLPAKKFILLGDDTQRDMDVYTQVINQFKDRIRLVFIRQTRISRTAEQERKWSELKNTGVEAYYFDDRENPENTISKIKAL